MVPSGRGVGDGLGETADVGEAVGKGVGKAEVGRAGSGVGSGGGVPKAGKPVGVGDASGNCTLF